MVILLVLTIVISVVTIFLFARLARRLIHRGDRRRTVRHALVTLHGHLRVLRRAWVALIAHTERIAISEAREEADDAATVAMKNEALAALRTVNSDIRSVAMLAGKADAGLHKALDDLAAELTQCLERFDSIHLDKAKIADVEARIGAVDAAVEAAWLHNESMFGGS
jgi:hypothetical protein